jgi:hypothetical protein
MTVIDFVKMYRKKEEKLAGIDNGIKVLGSAPYVGGPTHYALITLEDERAKLFDELEDLGQRSIEVLPD